MREQQWMDTRKWTVTKAAFPSVKKRINQKISTFSELNILISGHGNLES